MKSETYGRSGSARLIFRGTQGIHDIEFVAYSASDEVIFFINSENSSDLRLGGILEIRIPRGQFVPRMALRILLAEA